MAGLRQPGNPRDARIFGAPAQDSAAALRSALEERAGIRWGELTGVAVENRSAADMCP
jgi:hypothetical protein